MREIALNFSGVDIIDEPAPIQPTAHYSMGGIPTNVQGQVIADAQGTPIHGFFAAGECACVSVHGANRLGTNSLLDASVFGRRAGFAIAEFIKNGAELQPLPNKPGAQTKKQMQRLMEGDGRERIEPIARELKSTMTQYCGIYRDQTRLQAGLERIEALQARFAHAMVMDTSHTFNTEILGAMEIDHLLNLGRVITTSALARTESRGAHSRTDFPTRDDEKWLQHTLAHQVPGARPKLSYKDVQIDWEKHPPQERKY